jgi:hypothetical protein
MSENITDVRHARVIKRARGRERAHWLHDATRSLLPEKQKGHRVFGGGPLEPPYRLIRTYASSLWGMR